MKLEIIGLKKSFGKVNALAGVDAVFEPGIYGLLGPNGAGKSTLINLLTDNVKRDKDGGEILFDGIDILKRGKSFRKLVGYMPQQQGFYEDFTAYDFLKYISEIKEIPRKKASDEIKELLMTVGLSDVAHRKVGGFSGGMKQRVLLAQALLGDPKILILDEPTAGLDPKERINFRNYIAGLKNNKIIIIATHVVSDVEFIADRVILMRCGKIIKNDPPHRLVEEINGKGLEDVYMHYLGHPLTSVPL